jgi:hypothetical protein
MLISLLDESTSLLKLYFGLQTGALVLFVKTLTEVHSPTFVLMPLAVSIFLFGLAALTCLKLLLGLVVMRRNMVTALVDTDQDWQQTFGSQIKEWQEEMRKKGNLMEWLFGLAVLFAGVFVIGVLITR